MRNSESLFLGLLDVMDTLLGENGCPWDREQTHASLAENMLEEAGEAVQAIDSGNMDELAGELGDVLLQVLFHAKIAEKNGSFTIDDVMIKLKEKLIGRHSHVFGEDTAKTAEEALMVWEKNKQKHFS